MSIDTGSGWQGSVRGHGRKNHVVLRLPPAHGTGKRTSGSAERERWSCPEMSGVVRGRPQERPGTSLEEARRDRQVAREVRDRLVPTHEDGERFQPKSGVQEESDALAGGAGRPDGERAARLEGRQEVAEDRAPSSRAPGRRSDRSVPAPSHSHSRPPRRRPVDRRSRAARSSATRHGPADAPPRAWPDRAC